MKTINIKGKNYVTVNERVKAFRSEKAFDGMSITTDVNTLTDDVCVMCARVLDKDGRVLATGWAREVRLDGASMVNKTSYVENCETSAVGRALGFLGIGIDESICSAQELQYALQTQNVQEDAEKRQKEIDAAQVSSYDELTEREQAEYDGALTSADFAQDLKTLYGIYNQFKDARFGKLLQAHCASVRKSRGW